MLGAARATLVTGVLFCLALASLSLLPEVVPSEGGAQKNRQLTPQQKFERLKQLPVDEVIELLQGPPYNLVVVNRLRQLSDRKAVPALKEAFEKASTRNEKQAIAAALVGLREEDERYWEFLVGHAKQAIKSKMPFPLMFDTEGRAIKGKFNPGFLAWCKQNNIDPRTAAADALYQQPRDVMFVGITGDPRAFDILLEALRSTNYLIVARAAQGLTRLQDKRAIKFIIQASKRAPLEVAAKIAEPLVFFDDPEAQAAAEELIQNKALLSSLRKRAGEKGVKGIFGEE